jgi:uncharacterized protein (DUF2147 family)
MRKGPFDMRSAPKKLMLSFITTLALAFALPAFAADPSGVWLTKDKAEITIKKCGSQYCGVVSKAAKPGLKDIRNPDPALNGRPIKGMPILWVSAGDKPNVLPGELYNPLDGKVYEGTLELRSENTLRVRGCVLRIFCLHEDWVRIGS